MFKRDNFLHFITLQKNLSEVFENSFLIVHLCIIPDKIFLFFFTVKNLRLNTKNLFNYLVNIQNVFRCKKFFFFSCVSKIYLQPIFSLLPCSVVQFQLLASTSLGYTFSLVDKYFHIKFSKDLISYIVKSDVESSFSYTYSLVKLKIIIEKVSKFTIH